MTLVVFIVSLLGAMAVGVPEAFALMFCGVVLMWFTGMFNTQIIAQNMIAVDGLHRLRRLCQCVDHPAVHGRYRAGPDDGHAPR